MGSKECTKCGVERGLEEFNTKKSAGDGRRSACKECENAQRRERYKKNPKIYSEQVRKYRENNKEKVRLKNKAYYVKNKERFRAKANEYRKKNKEKISLDKKAYYQEHKEEIKANLRGKRLDDKLKGYDEFLKNVKK